MNALNNFFGAYTQVANTDLKALVSAQHEITDKIFMFAKELNVHINSLQKCEFSNQKFFSLLYRYYDQKTKVLSPLKMREIFDSLNLLGEARFYDGTIREYFLKSVVGWIEAASDLSTYHCTETGLIFVFVTARHELRDCDYEKLHQLFSKLGLRYPRSWTFVLNQTQDQPASLHIESEHVGGAKFNSVDQMPGDVWSKMKHARISDKFSGSAVKFWVRKWGSLNPKYHLFISAKNSFSEEVIKAAWAGLVASVIFGTLEDKTPVGLNDALLKLEKDGDNEAWMKKLTTLMARLEQDDATLVGEIMAPKIHSQHGYPNLFPTPVFVAFGYYLEMERQMVPHHSGEHLDNVNKEFGLFSARPITLNEPAEDIVTLLDPFSSRRNVM
jgi:hypothetical protein